MKSSISCQLCRTAIVAALALILPDAALAQTQLLVNPNFQIGAEGAAATSWSTLNDGIGNCTIAESTDTYYNAGPPNGECAKDATAENVNVLIGTECGKIYGDFNNANNINEYFQTFAAVPGSTWSAGGFGYSSHEDLMNGNQFWYEVDFYSGASGAGTLLASYESFVVEGLTCTSTTPFAVDAWNGLPVTNVMQVTTGTNTGTVTGNIAPGTAITAPAGTASVAFRVVYDNINYGGGSMYVDGTTLNQLTATAASASAGPTNVIATLGYAANANAVLVSFYQNDNTATGYNLWRATNADGPYMEIATNETGTLTSYYYVGTNDIALVDTNAVAGPVQYFYEVQAVNGNGASAASSAAGVFFGQGNQLVDAGFEDAQIETGPGDRGPGILVGWDDVIGDSDDAYGYLNNSGNTYCDGCNGTTTCPHDANAGSVIIHSGAQMAKVWTVQSPAGGPSPPYNANGIGFFHQTVSSPGGTWSAGGWALDSHQDLIAGCTFDFEVDFLDSGGNLLAAYESFLVPNDMPCTGLPGFPTDTWNYLAVTNEMQVIDGTNAGVVLTNIGPSGIMVAPHDTAAVTFQATANGNGGTQSGSTFFDDCVLDAIQAPVLALPTITGLTPDVLFSTNTSISCNVNSTDSVITNVQAVVTTSTLGGTATTVTNNPGSGGLTVVGLNTATANVSLALTPNLLYQVDFIGIDGNNLSVQAKSSFDTLSPTLVIEASDFNFGGGSFIDTPANGGLGLYYNVVVGNQGADENWTRNVNSPVNDNYRPNDDVTIEPAAPGNGMEQKFANVAAAIANGTDTNTWDVPQELGYSAVGDWMNYTRSYGSAASNSAPAGLYNVYSDMANVGTAAVALYQVSGDITSSDQTSNLLGYFTITDNGWNTYDYTPLRDAYGNLASVSLSGTATLKAEVSAGGPNIGFFFLMPSAGQGPSVTSVYPTGLEPYGPTNAFTFTLGPGATPSGASTISGSGVSVTLNGVNVTSSLTFSGSSTNLTGSLPITQQNVYTAVITATNAAGLVTVSTVTFNNFDPSDYSFDFSDYDFSTSNAVSGWVSGQFIDDNAPSADSYGAVLAPPNYAGTLATNSYFEYPKGFTPSADPLGIGALARQGVDINFPENGQTGANAIYYRIDKNASVPGNNNDVGMQPSDDPTDGFRTKYLNAQSFFSDPNIGSFNLGYNPAGAWLNYTRTFPAGNFYLWGRFSDGAGSGFSNMISQVTSGVGTSNQTTAFVGNFAGNPTAGWGTYDWFPMRDVNGNMVNLALGGKETLRLTIGPGGNNNPLFVMLVPAPTLLQLSASIVAGQINISFPTQSGLTYTIYETSSLSTPNWTQAGSSIIGTGAVVNVPESLGSTQGYFKATGVPSP